MEIAKLLAEKILARSYKGRVAFIRNEIAGLLEVYSPSHVKKITGYVRKHYGKLLRKRDWKALAIPADVNLEMKTKYAAKIAGQSKVRIEIDPVKIIEIGIKMAGANDRLVRALALSLFSGRRISEILCTGFFAFQKSKVLFSGQIKKKECERLVYEIPILIDKPSFKNLWVDFVKEKPRLYGDLTNIKKHIEWIEKIDKNWLSDELRKINNNYSSDLSARVKSFYQNSPILLVKDLRAAYAAICAAWYKPEQMTDRAYLSSILGHSENDLTTAGSYEKFYIRSIEGPE